jgi:hypothetical protein
MAAKRLVPVLLCAGGPGLNGIAEVLGFSSATADKLVTVGTDKATVERITT